MVPRLPRSGRWSAGIAIALAVSCVLAPGLAAQALAQAGSDFIAYPKTLTEPGAFTTNRRQLTFNRMPGLSPDYRLGAEDLIQVTVVGRDAFERRLNADGDVSLPLVGSVSILDLTAEEAEAKIAAAYRDRDLIREPQVLIHVTEYQSKSIYVLGEVDRPGEYSVSFQMTLMDLIFIAGGLDFSASRYGFLHRRVGKAPPAWRPAYPNTELAALANAPDVARPDAEVLKIDLQPMKHGGVLERNLVLRHGDVLYVPRRHLVFAYVVGDVNRPGAFELPETNRVSAVQAISWAGGPAKTARMRDGILVRTDAGGARREFPVDFAAILEGRQADVDVKPNDMIFIPGSGGKALGYGLLNTLPTMATYLLVF